MSGDNVYYWGLIVLAFIIKVREDLILIMPVAIIITLIEGMTATSPTRFMNYGQNIVSLDTAKSLLF